MIEPRGGDGTCRRERRLCVAAVEEIAFAATTEERASRELVETAK